MVVVLGCSFTIFVPFGHKLILAIKKLVKNLTVITNLMVIFRSPIITIRQMYNITVNVQAFIIAVG